MMDYYLAILFIIIVFIFGLMGYYVPIIGVIGIILGFVLLIPLSINPTVIMGIGYNSTSGTTYMITETITELRTFSVFVLLLDAVTTITGALKRLLN